LGRVKEEDPATRCGANEVQGHGGKLGTRNRLMVARREGQPVVSGRVAHIGGGGGRSFGSRGFYSRRRVRELAAGPHIGVDSRHQGGLVVAAVSGREREPPVPRLW
jgi:hypothetical protein